MFSHPPHRAIIAGRRESYKNQKEMIAKSQPSLNPGQSSGLSRAGIPPPLSHVGALEGGMFVLSGCAGYGPGVDTNPTLGSSGLRLAFLTDRVAPGPS